jgi:hypothetical protein
VRANHSGWRPDFHAGHPAFSTIAPAAKELRDTIWPSLVALDACLANGKVRNARGSLLRVVDADATVAAAPDFEARALDEARLAVRQESWHDIFNVLVWRTFPTAKAALNERHCAELRRTPDEAKQRGRVRDTLTLLDESGVIVAASDATLFGLIREFRWKELFWRRRSELLRSVRVHVFGHAVYEKLLSPFVGMIGHAVLLEVEQTTIDAPVSARVDALDGMLGAMVADASLFESPRELQPLPVLGMPGWLSETDSAGFYDHAGYFRPGRRERTNR